MTVSVDRGECRGKTGRDGTPTIERPPRRKTKEKAQMGRAWNRELMATEKWTAMEEIRAHTNMSLDHLPS